MSAKIIDGKAIAGSIRTEIAEKAKALKEERGITPGLAVVLVGEDPASKTYVRNKEKACGQIGIYSEVHRLPESAPQEQVLGLVKEFNDRPEIDGILVQLPLPKHIDSKACLEAISPDKDVDGFHPVNVGRLLVGEKCFIPCTPHGVMVLLERTGVDFTGKEAVIVGRSNIVGKPVAMLLMQRHATVTICHTRTRDLAYHTGRAELLVVAAGRPRVITGDMIKEGAVVIDVGVNSVDGKLVGDVDFESASKRASAITPVPGGVGPMTITMLMLNTLQAATMRR